MSFRPTPRTHFTEPTVVRYEQAILSLWGDQTSDRVSDWFYVSSEEIHALVFALPPGGVYRHSDDYRTVYNGDVCYYLLAGTLTLHNPETGEVQVARPGEVIFFQADAWHHGYNFGREEVKVWEMYAPPPAKGGGLVYGRTRPNLTEIRYGRDELIGRWPGARAEAHPAHPLHVIREADILWRLEGSQHPTPVGLFFSGSHLTAGRITLPPNHAGDAERHAGEEVLYVLDGRLNVYLPDSASWREVNPGDVLYMPAGIPHQYFNVTDREAAFVFGVAPGYLPPA